ncbi:MAG TPA: ABC transporter ATP-binding protein [Burkholderiales bacterium]|nr:ABC transporter ATP-binding protein [Burkholderiales bacterium]
MAEPTLRVDSLSKHFGGVVALDAVTLEVHAGEIHALIGPNGAGKTTLVHLLSGALAPDTGRVHFDGADVTARKFHERVALGLARSYQVTSVFRAFSALDNVALAVQARSGSSLRFWAPLATERALFDEARAVLAEIGLAGRDGVPAGHLAHGEQRALEVGLALATRPKVLLLDEPMAGMGPEDSERMIALIDGLKARLTVLLIEHDMDAVFRLADRISVLVNGRVIATGPPDEIRANDEVRRAYLGEEQQA